MDELFTAVRQALTPRYGEGEARAIAFLLLEEGFGLSRTSIYAGKVNQFSQHEREQLHTMCQELVRGVPVQQVLGWEWFHAHRFRVTPDVLIPRPETEQLVDWAVELALASSAAAAPGSASAPLRLLDAGTGSGCIAVSLYLALSERGVKADVEAWDVSEAALEVARGNASDLGAEVRFARVDMLGEGDSSSISSSISSKGSSRGSSYDSSSVASCADAGRVAPNFVQGNPNFVQGSLNFVLDLIVSNPPYVCERERAEMEEHVLEHEPGLALFVPDDDPLRFYKALCRLAQQRLASGGWLVVEGNCAYAEAMRQLFIENGLQQVEVRTDCFGRPRFVAGRKN